MQDSRKSPEERTAELMLSVVFSVIMIALTASWYYSLEIDGTPGPDIHLSFACLGISGLLILFATPIAMSRLKTHLAVLVVSAQLLAWVVVIVIAPLHSRIRRLPKMLVSHGELPLDMKYGIGVTCVLLTALFASLIGCALAFANKDN